MLIVESDKLNGKMGLRIFTLFSQLSMRFLDEGPECLYRSNDLLIIRTIIYVSWHLWYVIPNHFWYLYSELSYYRPKMIERLDGSNTATVERIVRPRQTTVVTEEINSSKSWLTTLKSVRSS